MGSKKNPGEISLRLAGVEERVMRVVNSGMPVAAGPPQPLHNYCATYSKSTAVVRMCYTQVITNPYSVEPVHDPVAEAGSGS